MSESDPPLIAECPSCQTCFRVTEQQLAVADGRVRCGVCLAVFDGRRAMDTVVETGAEALRVEDDPIGLLLDTDQPGADDDPIGVLLGTDRPGADDDPIGVLLGTDRPQADDDPIGVLLGTDRPQADESAQPDSSPAGAEAPDVETGAEALRVEDDPIGVLLGTDQPGADESAQPDSSPAGAEEPVVETGAGALRVEDDSVGVLLDTDQPGTDESAQPDSLPAGAEEPVVKPAVPKPDRPLHPVVLAAAVAACLAFLVAGAMALQYDVLVQHPVLREAYEIAGVDVPRYKALDAIQVANWSVGERLGAPEDLIVRVDLTNTAPRAQRFPMLAVRFLGADGALLPGEQHVEPAQYLPSPTHSRRMMPNRTAPVVLRLDDPGPDAVNYSVSLR